MIQSKDAPTEKAYYRVASLERGLRIVELLAARQPLSVTDVARHLGQNRSASHRFLATLRDLGYVVQGEDARYRLSLKLFELGNRVADLTEIRTMARPLMKQLVLQHGETVNLGCMEGGDVVTIEVIPSPQALRFDSVIGHRSPVHTLAMGKAMLAFRPKSEQQAYIEQAVFKKLTDKTITDATVLQQVLEAARKDRYAIDDEEWTDGLRCVAVPVFDGESVSTYAISVSGPAMRMTEEKIGRIRKDLHVIASALSREIGGRLAM